MERFWRRSGIELGKRWVTVVVVIAAITAAMIPGLARSEFATGQDSYLNSDSQIAIDNVGFQDQFGGETAVLLFSATDPDARIEDLFSGGNLAELERITTELERIPEAAAVITPLVSLQYSDALIQGPGRDALLSAQGRDPDPDGAAARAADVGVSLGRLGGIPADDQVIGDPEWAQLLIYDNTGFASDAGTVTPPTDPDSRSIRLSLASTFPNSRTAVGGVVLQGNATLDALTDGTDAVIEVIDTAELDGFEVTPTGSPVYLRDINDYLQGGMLTLGVAALVVMAFVLVFMFRVRWRLLPLAAVVIGVVWAFAILGYLGIDLSLVTISGLPILIGLGIDFAIQVHNRVEEEVVLDSDEHPIAETLSNIVPPLIAAVVGAVLAFLALQVSQVPMIRDFGVLLAIGVVVLLVTGVVFPTAILGIREWTDRTEVRGDSLVERIVVKLGGLSTSVAPAFMVASILVFGLGVAVEGNVEIESDPIEWVDQGSQTVKDLDRLTEETGFASTLGVLVEANNVFADEVNEVLWAFTLAAEERPEVVSTSSMVNTMGKIIMVPGGSLLTPTPQDIAASVDVMPPAVRRALLNEDGTATQVNLRLASASLEERAELIDELEADLQARIDAVDLPSDSILLVGIDSSEQALRAVPSGLAVVGVGLLENLSANRAILTYLGLVIVAVWLTIRYNSIWRALLALVPVALAVGVSNLIVGVFGLTLSPLTTVGGPLVIATCTEFSVLILGRYVEERQKGLPAREATDRAAARTGRAFFTSAATTIGGFAVLIGSALPLLRDFGIIVTMNVAVALLAALIVMPPLMVWADERGWLATSEAPGSVRLAVATNGGHMVSGVIGGLILVAVGLGLLLAADTDSGEAQDASYEAVALPPTPTPVPTPTPTPTPEPDEGEEPPPGIDVSQFGTERPAGLIDGTLFDLLVGVDVDPQQAVCTAETLLSRVSESDLLASGIATFSDEAIVPVVQAGLDCGLDQAQIDAAVAVARGE
ncbi:MAG: MMPL family transporter [Actinomycetota bacterium]